MTPVHRRRAIAFALSVGTLSCAPAAPAPAPAGGDAAVAAIRHEWKDKIDVITAAANELTDAEYAYRPVATVRSFGQIVGHVAGVQNHICAAVIGDKLPAEDVIEKTITTKAALVAALTASTVYCERAYAVPAANSTAIVDLYYTKFTKLGALSLNAVHTGEHYGNIVTYMRMQGMVPPSSRKK